MIFPRLNPPSIPQFPGNSGSLLPPPVPEYRALLIPPVKPKFIAIRDSCRDFAWRSRRLISWGNVVASRFYIYCRGVIGGGDYENHDKQGDDDNHDDDGY